MANGKFSKPRGCQQPVSEQEQFYEPEFESPKEPAYSRKPSTSAANRSNAFGGKRTTVILVSICSVIAVLLIAIIVSVWFLLGGHTDDGLILNNVSVAGIDLSGMTPEEAETALHRATDLTYSQKNMVIELPDTTLELSPADTGAKLDVEAAVEAAYEYGRTGTRAEREQAKADSLTTSHPIAVLPYLGLNTEYIRTALEEYGISFNSTYTPSSATVEGEMPILDVADENFNAEAACQTLVLKLGTPGRNVDIDALYNRVLDAYSFNTFLVTMEMTEAEAIPEAIDLQALYDQYCTAPVDAAMDKETFEVTPEVYGYSFDLEEAQILLDQAQYGDTVEIPFTMVAPANSSEGLADLLFRDVLASYKTAHTKDQNRNTNLELACKAINGTVLEPGEVFDYNTVVGKRTAEAGYKSADAYSGGKTVKTLGGGICQVSSTIYYCCLISDMEIVERSPHSYVSSYMPMGMDATVSWGGPEFSFKNNTNYPVRIECWVADGYVHAQLIGTDEKDYYIEMEYEVISYEAPETVYEVYSPDNEEGYKDGEVIQTAYRGYTVRTYKLKYDKETKELISKEEDRVSKYKKRDKIIVKIGTPAAPTEEPTEAPAAPTEAPAAPTEAPAAPTEAPAAPTEAPAAPTESPAAPAGDTQEAA